MRMHPRKQSVESKSHSFLFDTLSCMNMVCSRSSSPPENNRLEALLQKNNPPLTVSTFADVTYSGAVIINNRTLRLPNNVF
jgi:hypothetical protein